jgi:hypothetical protein
MNRLAITSTLLVSTLLCGCETPIEEELGQTGNAFTHNADQIDGAVDSDAEIGEVHPSLDDHADGLGTPEPTDPSGRITGMIEDGGDLVVTATVGPDVLAVYPSAHAYRMRFVADASDTIYIELADVEGVVLEGFRQRTTASAYFPGQNAPQYCWDPLGSLGSGMNCYAPPCPWEEQPEECLEVVGDAESFEIRGEIAGEQLARQVTIDGDQVDVIDLAGGAPDDAQAGRLNAMAVIFADLEAVIPEIEPLGGACALCVAKGILGAKGAALCVTGALWACEVGAMSLWLASESCGDVC